MQPYRLASASASAPSCLDPPIRACDPPPRRTWRFEAFVAGVLFFAGTAGAWVGHAIGRGGHVEIAPNALLRARAHAPRAKTTRERRPTVSKRLTTSERALLRGVHDPKELLSRAKTLESLGLDVTVVDVPLSNEVSNAVVLGNDFTSWKPVYNPHGNIAAFEVGVMPLGSPLRIAGLDVGDRLMSVDGWDLEEHSVLEIDANAIRKRASVVVELDRGGHHVVLAIHWKK